MFFNCKMKVFILVSFSLCVLPFSETTTCPTRGKQNVKSIPNVLSLVKNQNGYLSKVEVIVDSYNMYQVEEYYNSVSRSGNFVIHLQSAVEVGHVYYYHKTDEAFTITNGECETSKLSDDRTKLDLLKMWLNPVYAQQDKVLFGDMEHLGPVAFAIYAASLGSSAQYVGNATIDGLTADHWFYCVTDDGPYLDYYYDQKKTGRPLRLVLSHPDPDNEPQTINYISFEPLINEADRAVDYPFGFGCKRLTLTKNNLPEITPESGTFNLKMEAAIYYKSPEKTEKTEITTADIVRYQNVISYEINKNMRLVLDANIFLEYISYKDSGYCFENENIVASYTKKNAPIKWPFRNAIFNLADHIDILDGAQYFGQIDSQQGRLDVFEKKFSSFFYDEGSDIDIDALATYFFPVNDIKTKAPIKTTIKPIKENQYTTFPSKIPERIEISYIDYSLKEDEIDLADRFDVSWCYDKKHKFTWFQVAFPDSTGSSNSNKFIEASTLKAFEKIVSPFIPKLRLPELRISRLETSVYVTGKLLDRPGFTHLWNTFSDQEMTNPTQIFSAESEEACSELCADRPSCDNFSYCNNLECRIFDSTKNLPTLQPNADCNSYLSKMLNPKVTSEAEANILKSSKYILHELKNRIDKGQIVIDYPIQMTASNLFIVDGPDEFGSFESELSNSEAHSIVGRNFILTMSGYRFTEGKSVTGIDYKSCLKLCDNDIDCQSLSYCPHRDSECMLLNNSEKITGDKTTQSDGCDIQTKLYLNSFKHLEGRSLVLDAEATMVSKDFYAEDCAKTCLQSKNFTCESFDLCRNVGVSSAESATTQVTMCFFHSFHLAKDSHNVIEKDKLFFSNSTCSHFLKAYSYNYKEILGLKFKDSKNKIIAEIEDVSLETCAASCTASPDKECASYEYCSLVTKSSKSKITTRCRFSTYKPSGASENYLEPTVDLCSVYVSMDNVKFGAKNENSNHLGLAIGLGSFFFLIAFIAGFVASLFYFK